MSDLPPFALQWVQQWKDAAPRLQAIRDEELRRLGGDTVMTPHSTCVFDGPSIYEKYPHANGMVVMQRWFMRKHLLDSMDCAKANPDG